MPTRFGIGFGIKHLNQGGALVMIYTDGSVLISHAGMEMGQGLHTKILQVQFLLLTTERWILDCRQMSSNSY